MGLFARLFGRSQARNIKPEVITPPAPPSATPRRRSLPVRSEVVQRKRSEASRSKSYDSTPSYSPALDFSSFDSGSSYSSSSSDSFSGGGGDFGGGGSSGDY